MVLMVVKHRSSGFDGGFTFLVVLGRKRGMNREKRFVRYLANGVSQKNIGWRRPFSNRRPREARETY